MAVSMGSRPRHRALHHTWPWVSPGARADGCSVNIQPTTDNPSHDAVSSTCGRCESWLLFSNTHAHAATHALAQGITREEQTPTHNRLRGFVNRQHLYPAVI